MNTLDVILILGLAVLGIFVWKGYQENKVKLAANDQLTSLVNEAGEDLRGLLSTGVNWLEERISK